MMISYEQTNTTLAKLKEELKYLGGNMILKSMRNEFMSIEVVDVAELLEIESSGEMAAMVIVQVHNEQIALQIDSIVVK